MSNERGELKLSSWDQLRVNSASWLEAQVASGSKPRFAHPGEVAEHVLVRIHKFVEENGSKDAIKNVNDAFRLVHYSDVVDLGQRVYLSYLQTHPEEKKQHIAENILESLVTQNTQS